MSTAMKDAPLVEGKGCSSNDAEDSNAKVVDSAPDVMDSTEDTRESTQNQVDSGQDAGDCVPTVDSTPEMNPYAYLDRDAFSSELFKVEIYNLPHYFGVKQMKKKLASLNLKPVKIKVLERAGYAFINFRNEDEREAAIKTLDGQQWKHKSIQAKKAKPKEDPLIKKRKLDAEAESGDGKASKEEDDTRTTDEKLNDSVTPLWRIPYKDQLQRKSEEMRLFMNNLARLIERENKYMGPWLQQQRQENNGVCCKMCAVKQSPAINNYRNKCEFTIGQSLDKKDKTIGFRLGSYKSGSVVVVEPTSCLHVPESVKTVLQNIQHYCQNKSALSGLDPETKDGNWNMVTTRTSTRDDVMTILHLNVQGLDNPVEAVDREKKQLVEYFTETVGSGKSITSLYLDVQQPNKKDGSELVHLLGETHIHEQLLGLKFRISPLAFFQVNTAAAEVLYSTVAELADINEDTVVLDICCGTGTIGLTLAKKAKQVIGIEMVKEAIDDAKMNAQLNGIENAHFYCSKAEEILSKLIGRYRNDQVVAIVDPPRAGLHSEVIRAIRRSEFVKRLVYVSCQPTGAKPNITDLTRTQSKRIQGEEFKLIQAVPVDLFPLTNHCELVMLFTRDNQN